MKRLLMLLFLSAGLAAGAIAPKAQTVTADTAAAGTDQLHHRLESILADPALTHAHVGLVVQVAETGEVLFERSPHRRFIPASNTKIVTGAVALHELGPDHRWETRLVAAGPIENGTIQGDLWVIGGGDPHLTREDLDTLAGHLRQAGVSRIRGDLIGDGRHFPPPIWGEGWTWEDTYTGWGAGVSALRLHPGRVRASLLPGASPRDPARLVLRSGGPLPELRNRVRTGAPDSEARVEFVPDPRHEPAVMEGWIPLDAESVDLFLAPTHPTSHLTSAFAERLEETGIAIQGTSRRPGRDEEIPEGSRTWTHRSDPLSTILPELLKPSDNQIAEMLLRTLGAHDRNRGSARAGLEVVEETLATWGISPDAIDLRDGSGMSRYNQVTPAALARLLRRLWQLPDFGVFYNALPVAAEDGTMQGRLRGTPASGSLRGKTGSLSAVRALSGYTESGDGRTLIYSLLLNGYAGPGDVAVALEDLLVEQISLYRRPVEPGWPGYRPAESYPQD